MRTCQAKHPETGRQCEAEEHDGRTLCMAAWPILVWEGLPPPSVCGAVHASGATCGLYAHAEDERHGANLGWGWLAWGAGLPDVTREKRSRQENNALSEREDKAAYEWGRGRNDEREGERVWRWW